MTVSSTNQTDWVYGLGRIGLVADLEVWLGITIACLPTITPVLGKYSNWVTSKLKKLSTRDNSQGSSAEARQGIGSLHARTQGKKFNRLNSESVIELGEGHVFGENETASNLRLQSRREGRDFVSGSNGTGIRRST